MIFQNNLYVKWDSRNPPWTFILMYFVLLFFTPIIQTPKSTKMCKFKLKRILCFVKRFMPIFFPVNCERNVLVFVKLMQNPLSHRKTKIQSKSFTFHLTHFRYMLTEIGSRDLGDQQRYNMLEVSEWSMTHAKTLFPVFSPSCPRPRAREGDEYMRTREAGLLRWLLNREGEMDGISNERVLENFRRF